MSKINILIAITLLSIQWAFAADVTFKVDMSYELSVDPPGVSIIGNFGVIDGLNDWTPGQIFLEDDNGDGVFVLTISGFPDGDYEYRYLNGNGWGDLETVPNECASGNNRFFTIENDNSLVLSNIYSSCEAIKYSVTFVADMSNETVNNEDVSIMGDFAEAIGYTNWQAGEIMLNKVGSSEFYTKTLQLPPGSYQYKFVNGTSNNDAEVIVGNCTADGNRTVTVNEINGVQEGPFCYSTCEEQCVEQIPIIVTFRLKFDGNEEIASSGVYLGGSFDGFSWQNSSLQLNDNDDDGIYEVALQYLYQKQYEFRFFNGEGSTPGSFEFAETYDFVANGCGVLGDTGNNRFIDLTDVTEDFVTEVYIYNSCDIDNVGISSIDNATIKIFPNPADNEVFVKFNADVNVNGLQINVTDILGNTVMQKSVENDAVVLQRDNLPTGAYFVSLVNSTGVLGVKKVIFK